MTLQTTPAAGQQPATAAAVVCVVHESMASLILLANLPLATSNVGNTSVYQGMLETIMKENTITDLKLADICAAIRTTWASRFGHLKPSERPKKGTFYYQEPKGKGRADECPAPRPQAQRNTAIKDKGPAPKHSEQQQQQKAPASNSHGKCPFRRSNRGGQKKASTHVAAPASDFLIASTAITIADQPSRPAPTAHMVAHIAPTGITTCREFEQGSSRLPGTAPYPTFQRSRSLMSRLGVTPTIETSKKFEEITRQEEQEEQHRIRNMFLNPAPAQQEDVEMQEVEIQEPDSDNESVVSWGSECNSPILPIGTPRSGSPNGTEYTGPITPSTSLYHVLEGTHPSPERVLRRLPANLQTHIGLQPLEPPPWHRRTNLHDRISSPI